VCTILSSSQAGGTESYIRSVPCMLSTMTVRHLNLFFGDGKGEELPSVLGKGEILTPAKDCSDHVDGGSLDVLCCRSTLLSSCNPNHSNPKLKVTLCCVG